MDQSARSLLPPSVALAFWWTTQFTEKLQEDPRSGSLFVFTNRRRTRLKILFWDGTGLWILTKRLKQGTFSWPKDVPPEQTKLALTPQALALLTDGVDLRGAKLRPWYEREG